jgi:hypothetical protein
MANIWMRLQVWVWIGFLILAAVLLAFLIRVIRFLVKRLSLLAELGMDHRQGRIVLRPCRRLWWLWDRRYRCDCEIELKDTETGEVSHTLAVKLIPTLRKNTEYCVGDMNRWQAKTNFLMPLPYGVIKLDFGYRKCRPRPVERVFLEAPYGSIPAYLFHPHPHALTTERRGEGRRYRNRQVPELSTPCWQAGVLLMDLDTLRRLETAPPDKQVGILQKDEDR